MGQNIIIGVLGNRAEGLSFILVYGKFQIGWQIGNNLGRIVFGNNPHDDLNGGKRAGTSIHRRHDKPYPDGIVVIGLRGEGNLVAGVDIGSLAYHHIIGFRANRGLSLHHIEVEVFYRAVDAIDIIPEIHRERRIFIDGKDIASRKVDKQRRVWHGAHVDSDDGRRGSPVGPVQRFIGNSDHHQFRSIPVRGNGLESQFEGIAAIWLGDDKVLGVAKIEIELVTFRIDHVPAKVLSPGSVLIKTARERISDISVVRKVVGRRNKVEGGTPNLGIVALNLFVDLRSNLLFR